MNPDPHHPRLHLAVAAAIVAFLLFSLSPAIHARVSRVHFVDQSVSGGNGDGSTWADAFEHLENALDVAVSGDSIWIARGVYVPGLAEDPTATFLVPRGVTLVGGFGGTETSEAQADPAAHPTVLSGDLAGDDLVDSDGVVENYGFVFGTNAYHVVTIAAGATDDVTSLHGLTITGGHANGASSAEQRGSALDCAGAVLFATHVRIQGNRAEDRAALWNCRLDTASGGGVEDSAFQSNWARDVGTISTSGGNWTRCLFENNVASGQGAAFYLGGADLEVHESIFRGNRSYDAAVIRHRGGELALHNVLFLGNQGRTGAIEISGSSTAEMVNVTLAGNRSTASRGAIYVLDTATIEIVNSILWGNPGGPDPVSPAPRDTGRGLPIVVSESASATVVVTHSIVENSMDADSIWVVDGVSDGGDNLDQDPLFAAQAEDTVPPSTDTNPRLLAGSPALDAGDDTAVNRPVDLDGNPRRQGDPPVVDMGAFEGTAPAADVELTLLTDGVTEAVPGEGVIYTMVATNTSAESVDVAVTSNLPTDLSCAWTAVPGEAADGPSTAGFDAVDLTLTLSAGADVTVTSDCEIAPGRTGTLVKTATVMLTGGDQPFYDPDPTNDSATDEDTVLTPLASLSIELLSGLGGSLETYDEKIYYQAGEEIIYWMIINNEGPSDDPAALLTATLPDTVGSCYHQCGGDCLQDGVFSALIRADAATDTVWRVFCEVLESAPPGEFSASAQIEQSLPSSARDAGTTDTVIDFVVVPIVFADGFESGTTSAWQP